MFQQSGPYRAFQLAAQRGAELTSYNALVVDIGAFTTDLGYVEFDQSFSNPTVRRPDVVQQSYPIGVAELDRAVKQRLPAPTSEALERLPSLNWERLKPRVYAGQEVMELNPAGGTIRLGGAAHAGLIREEITAFAERVAGALAQFQTARVRREIHAHILTGGGSLIRPIRDTLISALGNQFRLIDLLDRTEPEWAIPARFTPGGAPYWNPGEVERRVAENRELIRTGSALGGASLMFE